MEALPDSSNGSPAQERCGSGPSPDLADFTAEERRFLLRLARDAVTNAVAGVAGPENFGEVPPRLARKGACFVTLTKSGALRGCIGNLLTETPLYQAVMENARGAATRDPRFEAVRSWEVSQLKIEISVLSAPEVLRFSSPEELLNQLRPHEHGVVFRKDGRVATFLPQVWEGITEKEAFLERLVEKAGYPPHTWRGPDVSLSVYHVKILQEEPQAGHHEGFLL
jgi:AmmeMemoRadiSam system protein A